MGFRSMPVIVKKDIYASKDLCFALTYSKGELGKWPVLFNFFSLHVQKLASILRTRLAVNL